MDRNIIYNEDCRKTMAERIDGASVDIVLTSPPYCTSPHMGKNSKVTLSSTTMKGYPPYRYDVFLDYMTPDQYADWTVGLFKEFGRVVAENGVVLYNISYSSVNRDTMFLTVADILRKTDFAIADWIGWKKKAALPNNMSPNKLTRIFEPVFVFARKSEMNTHICNKAVVSYREKTGQKMFENVFNFVEAANNDGACRLNHATYSSELCEKLLKIYGRGGMLVYDPFMGSGTTAVACARLGMDYLGSEISEAQVAFANDRLSKETAVKATGSAHKAAVETGMEQGELFVGV